MSPETSLPAPNPNDRISSDVIEPAGLPQDPTNQNIFKKNTLPTPDSASAEWWNQDAPSQSQEAVESSKHSLAYKAGFFIGKHFGKKLVISSFEDSELFSKGDTSHNTAESNQDTKISDAGKTLLEAMGYSPEDPEGIKMLGYYEVPAEVIELELTSIFSAASVAAEGLSPIGSTTEIATNSEADTILAMGSEAVVTPAEAAARLERDRSVKDAPRLVDIARDTSRTNVISHIEGQASSFGADPTQYDIIFTETEQKSVVELVAFFESVVNLGYGAKIGTVDRAADMLENLTFIGGKERAEAIKGIAEHWKQVLKSNSKAQICVIAEISSSDQTKSDKFMLDSILAEFSDEELVSFEGRLVTDLADLTADPEDARVILLDDWVISGTQATAAYNATARRPEFEKYKSSIELQLVTSTQDRIDKGFIISGNGLDPNKSIPIRAYFRSHTAKNDTHYTTDGHRAYETGSHSSVDFDFEHTYISDMLGQINNSKKNDEPIQRMPATTRIVRGYRASTLQNIKRLDTLGRRRLSNNGAQAQVDSGMFEL